MKNVLDQLFGDKKESNIEQEIQSDIEQQVSNLETETAVGSVDNTPEVVVANGVYTPEDIEIKAEGSIVTDDFPPSIGDITKEDLVAEVPVATSEVVEDETVTVDKVDRIKAVLDETPSTDFELVNLKNKIYNIIN